MKKTKILLAIIIAAALIALVFSACPGDESSTTNPTQNGPYLIILPDPLPAHGVLKASHTSAMKNTQITITATPDSGYKVSYVRYNGINIQASGSQYIFAMPAQNAEITAEFEENTGWVGHSYPVYNDGLWTNSGPWVAETNDDWGLVAGAVTEEANAGRITGTKAIKIDVTAMKDYFALRIPLDAMDLKFEDIDALKLWARAGTKTSPYVRIPAINRIAFGDYSSDQWVKSVWYLGEESPTTRYVALGSTWKEITVPIPNKIDHEINTLTLFFTTEQVLGQVIYIDDISFIEAQRELVAIFPAATGSIPYSKNTGSALASDLNRLTRATRFIYNVDGSRYTLYGEDPADGADAFLNKMSDFYDDIKYYTGGNLVSTLYTPSGANTSFYLTMSYGGKDSTTSTINNSGTVAGAAMTRMNVTVKGLPKTASGDTLIFEDFSGVQTVNDGGKILVQMPYYWGGTAGDAQKYAANVLHCWVDNIMAADMPLLTNGLPLDRWYVAGNLDMNCDFSGLTKLTINGNINSGIRLKFSLSSGYPTVPSTLNSDMKKYKREVVLVGKGGVFAVPPASFAGYDFNFTDFTGDAEFDWSNITGWEFFLSSDENEGNEASFAITDPCHMNFGEMRAAK